MKQEEVAMSAGKRIRNGLRNGLTAAALLALLTGCGGGFFPPLTTTTTTTGGGGPTTAGNFVYVANRTTSTISGFAVGTSTSTGAGTLTAVTGSPYAFSATPMAMAMTPSDSFLYIAGAGGIYAYSINSTTGALTATNSGSAVAIDILIPVSMDISPDGNWLFALNADGVTITEYQINTSTGGLSVAASPSYVPASGTVVPQMIRVAPNGAYVFVTLGTGGDLVFPFTTATGALGANYQQLGTGSTTTSDNAIAIDSTASFAYIARSGSINGLAVYNIGQNGALSSVAGSPFTTGAGPFSVLLDSTGKYVYTANRTDNTISGFSIGTGAVLTALSGSPYASGTSVTSLARDKSGAYIAAAAVGGSADLTLYNFSSTVPGNLNSTATTTTGTDPTGAFAVVATR